jgi:hypothetical protein
MPALVYIIPLNALGLKAGAKAAIKAPRQSLDGTASG